jgi:hypothetical protein
MATCEVCETLKRSHAGRAKRVLVGERLVALCAAHLRVVATLPVHSLAAVRRAFPENGGRRSLLERRQDLDRRAFPARPEGRRHNDGRRSTDRVA